jgi:hypothetical protein
LGSQRLSLLFLTHGAMHNSTLNCRTFLCISRANRHGDIMQKTEEYLVETADRCTRLAREGRGLIEQLEAISHELMAKAVEIDTKRDKKQNDTGVVDETSTS